LVWHGQEEFECEEKSKELNDVQQKEHHLITCMSGKKKSYTAAELTKISRLVENLEVLYILSTNTGSKASCIGNKLYTMWNFVEEKDKKVYLERRKHVVVSVPTRTCICEKSCESELQVHFVWK
jgi:hypothetical protein